MPRSMMNLKMNINKKFLETGVLPVDEIARLHELHKNITPRNSVEPYIILVRARY